MNEAKVISGNTKEEIWQQVEANLAESPDLFEYSVIVEESGRMVELDIDIDLGGGFEGGYAFTRFVSALKNFDDFRFSLHRQDFFDGLGKLFGMQDIVVGYPEFDKQVIVKTNYPERLHEILSDKGLRELLQSFTGFTFHIGHHHSANTQVESAFLELRIDEGITEPVMLREIYTAFVLVLNRIDLEGDSIMKYL